MVFQARHAARLTTKRDRPCYRASGDRDEPAEGIFLAQLGLSGANPGRRKGTSEGQLHGKLRRLKREFITMQVPAQPVWADMHLTPITRCLELACWKWLHSINDFSTG